MKRLSLLGFVGLLASVLAGCPIFGDGQGGSQGVTPGCFQPADCQLNETCGADNQCHSGDCTQSPCLAGYVCSVDPGVQTASCVPGPSTGSGTGGAGGSSTGTGKGGSGTTSTGTGTGGPPPIFCGHPSDCVAPGSICAADGTCHVGACNSSPANACIFGYACQSDGTCKSPTPGSCEADSACASGSLCIAGDNGKGSVCTVQPNQCFDQSQCGVNEKCAAGKCTLGCTTDAQCRDGFACDTKQGVCSTPVAACAITNDCGSAKQVCVGGACVPRSVNGSCPAGDVWSANGCIPNQAAVFTCTTEGQLGSGQGTPGLSCAQGSICLYCDCWISCDAPN